VDIVRAFTPRNISVDIRQCTAAEAGTTAVSVPLPVVMQHDDADEFCREVLSKFHPDPVGKVCQSDEVVIALGKHLYRKCKQKKAKKPDVQVCSGRIEHEF